MFQIHERVKPNEFRYFTQSKLQSLWENQLALNEGQPISLDVYSRKGIFNWFKNSPEFRKYYVMAINYVLKPPSEEELKEIKQVFAAMVHQCIAYSLLAAEAQNEGTVLLNPYNTLIFYETLLVGGSTDHRRNNLFGDIGLNHYSIPDGLILQQVGKEIAIKEMIDYTLTGHPDKFQKRLIAFLYDRQKYPDFFEQVILRFVIPLTDHHQRYKDDLPSELVEFSETPITHHQYRIFINGIFSSFRGPPILSSEEIRLGEENPTLMELLQWAQTQKQKNPNRGQIF